MRIRNLVLGLAVVVFTASTLNAYKDKTHQKLTEQACKIATSEGAGPVAAAEPDGFRQAIINGAGRHFSGEDYTKYWVLKFGCKYHVIRFIWPLEPLNHFHFGMNGGTPAIVTAADACGVMGSGGQNPLKLTFEDQL